MPPLSRAFTRQTLCIELAALKATCPKAIYVAPIPDQPLQWSGVLFVRKGPYANAILRFDIHFPDDYPYKPPLVVFLSDCFHPLVSPLTTYTSTTRDRGEDTVSAADEQRLPPGGLSLRHGFPEWFAGSGDRSLKGARAPEQGMPQPHVLEVLYYVRVVFESEAVLDSIPLDVAANTGAWHAWQSFRSKGITGRSLSTSRHMSERSESKERSLSPQQQPGGARRPGEWNWQGVWEDRVRKSVNASIAEQTLFGSGSSDVIEFLKMDGQEVEQHTAALRERYMHGSE